MKLPNAELAVVPEDKVVRYLLNAAHPVGGSKAALFRRFGFAVESWRILADELQRHALENGVSESEVTPYGTRYSIDGPLRAPNGAILNVRSAWFIDFGAETPRFVIAHPLPKNRT